jgi:ferredoxin
MATRKIVKIDEEKCTGCGLCIPNCAEGALQIVDGKAKLVSEKDLNHLVRNIWQCFLSKAVRKLAGRTGR